MKASIIKEKRGHGLTCSKKIYNIIYKTYNNNTCEERRGEEEKREEERKKRRGQLAAAAMKAWRYP